MREPARRQWLTAARRAARLTQEKLAQAIGVDTMSVSRWERGTTATIDLRHHEKLAHALHISLDELDRREAAYGDGVHRMAGSPTAADSIDPSPAGTALRDEASGATAGRGAVLSEWPLRLGPDRDVRFSAVADIRAAVNDHRFEPSDTCEAWDLAAVEHAVAEGQGLYQAAHYSQAGAAVPWLIRQAEAATRTVASDVQRRRAHAALATTYHLVTALLSRIGETELGWVTADRAIRAAEQTEDPDLIAAGLLRLGHIMLRSDQPDEAHMLATGAPVRAGITEPQGPARVSLRGALALTAAVASARHDDRRETLQLLRQAGRHADELGEDRNDHWTAFGPTNVRIHATTCAVELDDPAEVIRQGETVDPDRLAPGLAGRRSHVHIDLAWAYRQQRNDPATVLSLLEAERIAPESIRYNVGARALIRECLQRQRRTATPGLRGLADRVGIT